MIELIKFGDVFKHKEKEYIFLAKTEDIVYAAQILNKENTEKINTLYEREERKRNSRGIRTCEDKPIFCFVLLQTKEFTNRMAHLHKPDHDESNITFNKMNIPLDREDVEEIKREILKPTSPVPIGLKELINNLTNIDNK